MDAKALVTYEDQTFSLEDVVLPSVQPDEIGIRVHFSGVSIGTEFALIRQKLSWGEFPICTGYMATGTVDAVGEGIDNFRVGDRVFVRGNQAMRLTNGTPVSCTQGGHASYIIRKPNNPEGCGIVPDGADMAAASMYVMPAVALNGLAQAQPEAAETVVVYGAGLVGIGAVALAALRGCIVIAVDISDKALSLATTMGADHVVNASAPNWREEIRTIIPEGADCVVEATGIPECVDVAVSLCRPRGKLVWQGNYGEAPISYRFLPAHSRQIKAFYPCHDGQLPFRGRVVRMMARGALKWERCITHRITPEEAPEVFRRINDGDRGYVGVVLQWI